MNNSVLAGLIVGGVVVTAVGAIASNSGYNPFKDYATVISVEAAYQTNQIPREVCGDQVVQQQAPVKDEHRVAGTVIGAVVGGVLGNQIGDGSGQKAATVVGAAAGGYAGNKIQKQMQNGNVEEGVEHRCVTVYDTEKVPVGFDVTYELDGVQSVVRMDRDPGKRIPVENGELVLSQS